MHSLLGSLGVRRDARLTLFAPGGPSAWRFWSRLRRASDLRTLVVSSGGACPLRPLRSVCFPACLTWTTSDASEVTNPLFCEHDGDGGCASAVAGRHRGKVSGARVAPSAGHARTGRPLRPRPPWPWCCAPAPGNSVGVRQRWRSGPLPWCPDRLRRGRRCRCVRPVPGESSAWPLRHRARTDPALHGNAVQALEPARVVCQPLFNNSAHISFGTEHRRTTTSVSRTHGS